MELHMAKFKRITTATLAAGAVLATSMSVAAPAHAGTSTDRTGAFDTYSACESHRKHKIALTPPPRLQTSACYQMGPGAAGWYYDNFWTT